MLSEKDQHFIRTLLQATTTRRVVWHELSTGDQYATTFKREYDVVVEKQEEGHRLRMTDQLQHELLSITSAEYVGIAELFEAARRALYNVDEAIDEIIQNIKHPGYEAGSLPARPRAAQANFVAARGLHRVQAA